MKVTISSATLKDVVAKMSKVVPPKPILPILECVLFEVDKDRVKVTGSNLGDTLILNCKCQSDEVGKFCFALAKLSEFVVADGDYEFNIKPCIDEKSMALKVKTPMGVSSFILNNPADFPAYEEPEWGDLENIPADAFGAMKMAAEYCIDNTVMPWTSGVYSDGVNIVATDCNAMFVYPCKMPKFLVKSKSIKSLFGLFIDGAFCITNSHLVIKNEYMTLLINEMSEKYGDYKSIMPTYNKCCTINKGVLMKSIKYALSSASSATNQVIMNFKEDFLHISSCDLDHGEECVVDPIDLLDNSILDFKTSFNGKILLQIIGHIEGDMVVVSSHGQSNQSVIFQSEKKDAIFLQSPLLIA